MNRDANASPTNPTAPRGPFLDPQDAERYERLLDEARRFHGVSLAQDAWRRLRRNPAAMLSLTYLVVLLLLALILYVLPFDSPRRQDTERQFLPPTTEGGVQLDVLTADGTQLDDRKLENLFGEVNAFDRLMLGARLRLFDTYCVPPIFGTDELGRDMLARVFHGARVSLLVGIVATLVSLVIGVTYGAVSGYLGGWVDDVMMRIVDVLYSIPFIFVVIYIITILNAEEVKMQMAELGIDRITVFFLLIGAIYWLTMARVVRGQVLSLKQEPFLEAARTVGAGTGRIVFLHLVPNVLGVVIVYLTLTIPSVMLFEAFLSFLGLGVEPPDVSWGLLANDGAQAITPVKTFWWLVLFPGLALGTTLYALNFLGDGLRDALDPKLKNR